MRLMCYNPLSMKATWRPAGTLLYNHGVPEKSVGGPPGCRSRLRPAGGQQELSLRLANSGIAGRSGRLHIAHLLFTSDGRLDASENASEKLPQRTGHRIADPQLLQRPRRRQKNPYR